MDKRRFIYKLSRILDNFRMFITPEVYYIEDIIVIRFKRKSLHENRVYAIDTAYTEDDLALMPRECIEEQLSENLRALYKEMI